MFLKDIVIDIKSVTDNQVKKYFFNIKKMYSKFDAYVLEVKLK